LLDHAIDAFYGRKRRKMLAEDGGMSVVKEPHMIVRFSWRRRGSTGSVYAPRPLDNPKQRSVKVMVAESHDADPHPTAGTGVVGATIDLKQIQDLVKRMQLGTSGYVYAVDATGVLIAHPNSAAFTHGSPTFSQVTRALHSSKTGSTVGRCFSSIAPNCCRIQLTPPKSGARNRPGRESAICTSPEWRTSCRV
jgi:hypothetical protein